MKKLELLCPQNHLVAGLVFDPEKTSEDQAKKTVLELKQSSGVPAFCIVCRSTKLHFNFEPVENFAKASVALIEKAGRNIDLVRAAKAKAAFN